MLLFQNVESFNITRCEKWWKQNRCRISRIAKVGGKDRDDSIKQFSINSSADNPPAGIFSLYNETCHIQKPTGPSGAFESIQVLSWQPFSVRYNSCSVGIITYLLASSVSAFGQPRVYISSTLWHVQLVTVLDESYTSTILKLQSSRQVNQSKFAWQRCMWHNYCACTDLQTDKQTHKT